ncbi:Plasmodium vivax Vir protein, putative [Plasmodium vivax]|uniref:Vir protein, putative n=1 Tax=Plasmodium vivax TaxID=5855 RepID=A0A1G4EAN4_PLAVI|nr:Plasmodium vivax Vir protein, putative [Plasmodium vivax]
MERNLYNFESVFKDFDSIFNTKFQSPKKKCSEIYTKLKEQYRELEDSFESYCNKAIAYLDYLEEEYRGDINAAKASIYLYCWLYDEELHKQKYNNNKINIYKMLLQEYKEIDRMSNIPHIFGNYLKNNIDENLKDLYHLYYKFDKFKNKKECESNYCKCAEECYDSYITYINNCNNPNNADFCNGLEEFRAQYNNYMSKNFTCDGDYKYLPSTKNFDISLILIPTIATLIITSMLFVLYKFTPLGSWMCPRSKHKYEMKENIGEQMYDTIHRSGINNNTLIKNPYTIAYHSMKHS